MGERVVVVVILNLPKGTRCTFARKESRGVAGS